MNKQTLSIFLACVMAIGSYAFGDTPSAPPSQPEQLTTPLPPTTQVIQPTPTSPADCSQLPADQLTFVTQFTDMNLKALFCAVLTDEQRQQVMAMTNQSDASGNTMNADTAMQKFLQDNNIPSPESSPSASTVPRRPASGGACPVTGG